MTGVTNRYAPGSSFGFCAWNACGKALCFLPEKQND